MNEHQYHKKILPYLDGSLTKPEKNEFEAFLRTNPEFEQQVKVKEEELDRIKAKIPAAQLSEESRESLEAEMRLSIQHLLKQEPKTFWAGIRIRLEDWFSR
jgi:anti-sigma factor RsiW